MKIDDDICAVATGMITSAIAIIRISGKDIISKLSSYISFYTTSNTFQSIKPRMLYRAKFKNGVELIDDIMLVYFKSPKSYTGEEMIELYCHGSLFIQGKILGLLQQKGIRLAEPGEFTLRAYLNGKMDLTQAEAVHDIITARDKWSHQLAIQQMRGGITDEINKLRKNLLELLMYVELELDFAEEDVEFASRDKLRELLKSLMDKINSLSKSYEFGQVIKNGVLVAIIGDTNVGKSTLMNVLLKEDKSIVSSIPGTTRDIIEDSLVYEGIFFRFADTAGIREAENEIEKIGIERAIQKALQAKIVLLMVDIENDIKTIKQTYHYWVDKLDLNHQKLLVLANKTDKLSETEISQKSEQLQTFIPEIIYISAKYKQNIHEILNQMVSYVHSLNITGSEHILTNARQWSALEKASVAATQAMNSLNNNVPTDLLAEDLKQVNMHLAEVTGEVLSNEILTEIFKTFCIGK